MQKYVFNEANQFSRVTGSKVMFLNNGGLASAYLETSTWNLNPWQKEVVPHTKCFFFKRHFVVVSYLITQLCQLTVE